MNYITKLSNSMSKSKKPNITNSATSKQQDRAKKDKKKISKRRVYASLVILLICTFFYSLIAFNSPIGTKNVDYVNIESEIYEDNADNGKPHNSINNIQSTPAKNEFTSNNLDKIVANQQIQITKLQKDYDVLIQNIEKVKYKNNLPEIILEFVYLDNLIRDNKDPKGQLQKLEVLVGQDYNLAIKVAKLKFFLKNKIKSSEELEEKFAKLIPKIIAKKNATSDNREWISNIKSTLSQLITIRKIDGVAKNPKENIDLIILKVEKLVTKQKYARALHVLQYVDKKYKPLLTSFVFDLKNAQSLKQVNSEIYSYLKILSK